MEENSEIKTYSIYIDYPLDAVHLKEMEEGIQALDIELGNVVVVDCSGMEYICSSGLRIFLSLNKDITAKGGKLIIRNLQPLVYNVFKMTGFSHIFNIE